LSNALQGFEQAAVATSEALVAALPGLQANRIVMLSPYTKEVNEREEW
jgi:maleate cis-trans isomerase